MQNRGNRKGFLGKRLKGWGFLSQKREKLGGFGHMALSSSSPCAGKQGRGRRSSAAADSAALGHGGGRGEREKGVGGAVA